MATTKVFTKNITNQISITGVERTDFSLNYLTDNALIGTFPLSIGYLNIDPVSGTFTSTSANGTFTGTIETNVDTFTNNE